MNSDHWMASFRKKGLRSRSFHKLVMGGRQRLRETHVQSRGRRRLETHGCLHLTGAWGIPGISKDMYIYTYG